MQQGSAGQLTPRAVREKFAPRVRRADPCSNALSVRVLDAPVRVAAIGPEYPDLLQLRKLLRRQRIAEVLAGQRGEKGLIDAFAAHLIVQEPLNAQIIVNAPTQHPAAVQIEKSSMNISLQAYRPASNGAGVPIESRAAASSASSPRRISRNSPFCAGAAADYRSRHRRFPRCRFAKYRRREPGVRNTGRSRSRRCSTSIWRKQIVLITGMLKPENLGFGTHRGRPSNMKGICC